MCGLNTKLKQVINSSVYTEITSLFYYSMKPHIVWSTKTLEFFMSAKINK